jgi:hypothetical protein
MKVVNRVAQITIDGDMEEKRRCTGEEDNKRDNTATKQQIGTNKWRRVP